MSSHRQRGNSPPRYYVDQPRATTGAVYVTSFDTASRGGSSSSQPRSTVSTTSSGRHSSVAYSAQPMRKSTGADGKTKTEYKIRPKDDYYSTSDSKKPLSISTQNESPPRRGSNIVSSPRQMTPTAVRDDSSRYLVPASSSQHNQAFHQRHNSTSVSDIGPREAPRERREKSYHSRAPFVQRSYHESAQPVRGSDDEQWSYTGPREQFDRDFPAEASRQRHSTSRKERPMSHYEIDRPAVKRNFEPLQPSSRHLLRPPKADPDRYDSRSGFDSDPDRGSELPKRRNSARQPVLHQRAPQDDGYSSARDDYEARGMSKHRDRRYDEEPKTRERHHHDNGRENERERSYDHKHHKDTDREKPRDYNRDHDRDYERDYDKDYDREYDRDYDRDYSRNERNGRDDRTYERNRKPRSREASPEKSSIKGLTTALGSLAAAGVMKSFGRDYKDKDKDKDAEPEDDEARERRQHRKHRHRSHKDDQDNTSEQENERRRSERTSNHRQDSSSSEVPDDQSSKRQRSRRRHRDDEENLRDKPTIDDGQPDKPSSRIRTKGREEADLDMDRPSHELVLAQHQGSEVLENRTISPGENEDDRPRRVQLVEPVREKEELRPRGILKPARQVPFPEDPNPVREGVAPLKDATKGGIPPNARWTKINRLLVNPEALEKSHERFEEREDYVIVLRVLTREEIKKLADKTKEIRESREREWQQKLEDGKYRGNDNDTETTYSDGEIDYNDDDGRSRPQLAIEPAPPAPPADLQRYSNVANPGSSIRAMPRGPPIPDINVEANYSQNV